MTKAEADAGTDQAFADLLPSVRAAIEMAWREVCLKSEATAADRPSLDVFAPALARTLLHRWRVMAPIVERYEGHLAAFKDAVVSPE